MSTMGAPPRTAVPAVSAQTLAAARVNVRDLLTQSAAFRALPPAQQQEIARHTVQVATYLAEPDGMRLPADRYAGVSPEVRDAYAFGQEAPVAVATAQDQDPGSFRATAAREGAAVAGQLLQQVNFPSFVAQLIQGVFHAIVQASIEQMEAYGQLVANVAKSLNQFRDENTTDNQGKDHIVDEFPDLFEISMSSDMDSGPSARVTLKEGVDESEAVKRVNSSSLAPPGGVSGLDDDTIQEKLVPAARTQLATSRQQLLATMVLMGINRIVITDGRIQAKVMYDFQARDNFRRNFSATKMDYAEGVNQRQSQYTNEYSNDKRDASYYYKGDYKWSEQPVLKLMSVDTSQTDAALQTKASLAGLVDINFKSDYLPLEKMADSFQIANIQNASRPVATGGPAAVAPGAAAGAAPGTATGSGTARP